MTTESILYTLMTTGVSCVYPTTDVYVPVESRLRVGYVCIHIRGIPHIPPVISLQVFFNVAAAVALTVLTAVGDRTTIYLMFTVSYQNAEWQTSHQSIVFPLGRLT